MTKPTELPGTRHAVRCNIHLCRRRPPSWAIIKGKNTALGSAVNEGGEASGVLDVKSGHEAVLDAEDVANPLVQEQLAGKVVNHLMHFSGRCSVVASGHVQGIDTRLDRRPLLRPIGAERPCTCPPSLWLDAA